MRARGHDPTRLDVVAFAADGAELEGTWPLRAMDRLCDAAAPEAPPADAEVVRWHARGELAKARGGGADTSLHLDAGASLAVTCQRCLQPIRVPLDVHRRILFVPGEEAAAALDAEREEDVLALTRALDLRELVEDELLLALPIVPTHEVCPERLREPAADEAPDARRASPFAALVALKRQGPGR